MSQIWLRGFELATNHHCSHASNFSKGKFLKMCKNCVHCKINDNLLLDSGLRLKPHQWVTPNTQEKEFWFYLHLLWSYSSNKVKHVNFIVIHNVASFDATQKMWWFQTSWCQELANGILHEWFGSNNFQSLLYLKAHMLKGDTFLHLLRESVYQACL